MIAGAFYGLDAIPRHWKNKLNKQVRHEVTAGGGEVDSFITSGHPAAVILLHTPHVIKEKCYV